MSARSLPEHLKVPWKIGNALWVFIAAWLVLPVALILLLNSLGSVWPFASQIIASLQSGSAYANFGFELISAILAVGMVGYYLRKYRVDWQTVGWRSFNPWRALLLILLLFGAFIVAVSLAFALVTVLIPKFNANQSQSVFSGQAAQSPSLSLLALVIIPPIIEETVFRGFIFPALAKKWGLVMGAILTSLLFAIAHLQANVGIYTFILSMILCFMYWRLKSIIPGIALHMINNLLAYLALTGGKF